MAIESLPESPQEKLKLQLLAGSISAADFLEKLDALDQSTPSREHCFENLRILEDSNVKEILEKDNDQARYKLLYSLTLFHAGQNTVGVDPRKALDYFEAALVVNKSVDGLEERDFLYDEGTIAYLKQDLPALELIYQKMPEIPNDRNKEIIGNFVRGLRERVAVDYNSDYFK